MNVVFVDCHCARVDGSRLPMDPPSTNVIDRSLSRLLDSTSLCAWATVTPDTTAHINIGYFAHSDQLDLYLLSHPGSLHCRNLQANASMAVAIFPSAQSWTEPGRGVQLFGTCESVADANVSDAEEVYARRFPAYAVWMSTLEASDLARSYRFWRFVPTRLKILDEPEFGDAVFIEASIVRT
jgi:uncharacterized protein YhbP (UPF0306 family)